MEKWINTYKEYDKKIRAYNYALWVLGWDLETELPKDALSYRNLQVETLNKELYKIQTNKDYLEAVDYLILNVNKLDKLLQVEIKHLEKGLRLIKKMPKDEYLEYLNLLNSATSIWAKAKDEDDFLAFSPTLEKIVLFNKKIVKYLETDTLKGYDVLLDLYEEGMTKEIYDNFFEKLKDELLPVVLNATSKKLVIPRKLRNGKFDLLKQKEFSNYLLDVFNYNKDRGLLKESNHPFTSNVSSTDVRITTKYIEDLILSSIFSTIHELGHGIYEQQIDPELNYTNLSSGTSMGIHESQSRLYENLIGRSYAFWEAHYDKLQEIFNRELRNISLLEFYQFVNKSERSLIRTEADELTYPFHIIIRYEIEKQLIDGNLLVKDLPKTWRRLYGKYIGKRPKNDKEGVLQDIHWASGAFGYFPSYALGSAYASQIYYYMNKDFNVETAISNGEISKVNEWLKEHVHKYGKLKNPKEIIKIAGKGDFDPSYYINYLKNKFQ